MGHVITTGDRSGFGHHAHSNWSTGCPQIPGCRNYFSKFCPQLSSITQLLRDLIGEDTSFLRSVNHQHAFDDAKALVTDAPWLAYYDVNTPVVLQVEASDHGLRAALLQPSK